MEIFNLRVSGLTLRNLKLTLCGLAFFQLLRSQDIIRERTPPLISVSLIQLPRAQDIIHRRHVSPLRVYSHSQAATCHESWAA